MKAKSRFVALIIATCLVVASSIGIIAWALAAANIGIGSKLSVTYEAAPHVVCTASATYQKKTDESATPFQSGTINMNYGDTSGSHTLNASNTALVLNDTNTYVVFEFTFTNNNKMNTMGINITLTDNGINNNLLRKYYFGDLSSKTISQKESTIKSSGIENSALSTKSVTLKQNQTTRIYMLLEISLGVKANYNSDSTNKFLFTLTSVEVTPDKVSYLSADWGDRVVNRIQNASATLYNTSPEREITDYYVYISIADTRPAEYQYQISVGTNSETDTSAYVQSDLIYDVTVFLKDTWAPDGRALYITIYSEGMLFAPKDSSGLFSTEVDKIIDNLKPNPSIFEFTADVSLLDISKVTNFSNMFASGEMETNITYPVGFPEEYK